MDRFPDRDPGMNVLRRVLVGVSLTALLTIGDKYMQCFTAYEKYDKQNAESLLRHIGAGPLRWTYESPVVMGIGPCGFDDDVEFRFVESLRSSTARQVSVCVSSDDNWGEGEHIVAGEPYEVL